MLSLALAGLAGAWVQTGKVDITPPEPLPLGGYTARGSKVLEPGGEPLYARTVVITPAGQSPIAIVSVETLTIPESLAAEVAARLPAGTRLFLAATHTHSAPDSQMLNDRMTFSIPGIASFKSRWLEWYANRIAAGVRDAMGSNRLPVEAWGVKAAHVELNRGRRVGALPDSMATLLGIRSNGRTKSLWLHYAAHAVFWGSERMQTSGDWPGAAAQQFSALVLPGAIGDVSPVIRQTIAAESNEVKIAAFAQTLDEAVARVRVESQPGTAKVAWAEAEIEMGRPTPHPEFARANRIPEVLAQSLVDKFAPKPPALVRAFRIGKVAVVGIPGEPTSHLGRRIRDYGRRFGFDHVLVCSHVGGWLGYLLDPEDYRRGGYEATLSFLGAEQGERVVAAGCRALDGLR